MKAIHRKLSFGAFVLLVPSTVRAEPPPLVYEGQVALAGAPLQGNHALHFVVFDSAQGGEALCAHDENAWPLLDGWFTVPLTGCPPESLTGHSEAYLEVAIDDDPPIAPRQRIGAVPWAWNASYARDLVDEQQKPRTIDRDATIEVVEAPQVGDGRFASITAALASLRDKQILPGATVTISVGHGDYSHDATIEFDHPNGERIRLVGDEVAPDLVMLRFRSVSGFRASRGHRFGNITGFHLLYEGNERAPNGIEVLMDGAVEIGNLVIEGFPRAGLLAGPLGGTIVRTSGGHPVFDLPDDDASRAWIAANRLEISGSGHGVEAKGGGRIIAPGVHVTGGTIGIIADEDGYVVARWSAVESTTGECFSSRARAYLSIGYSTGTDCLAGVYAASAAYANASYVTLVRPGSYGLAASIGASLSATGANVSGGSIDAAVVVDTNSTGAFRDLQVADAACGIRTETEGYAYDPGDPNVTRCSGP